VGGGGGGGGVGGGREGGYTTIISEIDKIEKKNTPIFIYKLFNYKISKLC